VITKVDHSMRVMKEPLFGPILPIQIFEDDLEAIALANDTTFGFDACIFSTDPARAEQIAAGLHAGAVSFNDVFIHGVARGEPAGSVAHDGGNNREPHWVPYSAAKLQALESAMSDVATT